MGQQGRLIAVTHPICINMIRVPQDESRSGSSQVVVTVLDMVVWEYQSQSLS